MGTKRGVTAVAAGVVAVGASIDLVLVGDSGARAVWSALVAPGS